MAKKYDIGFFSMGNGWTVANRAEEEHGDYKKIAHIGRDRKITYFDNNLPADIKKQIEDKAKGKNEPISASQKDYMIYDESKLRENENDEFDDLYWSLSNDFREFLNRVYDMDKVGLKKLKDLIKLHKHNFEESKLKESNYMDEVQDFNISRNDLIAILKLADNRSITTVDEKGANELWVNNQEVISYLKSNIFQANFISFNNYSVFGLSVLIDDFSLDDKWGISDTLSISLNQRQLNYLKNKYNKLKFNESKSKNKEVLTISEKSKLVFKDRIIELYPNDKIYFVNKKLCILKEDGEKWSNEVETKVPEKEGILSGSASEIASASKKQHSGDIGKAIQGLTFRKNQAGENMSAEMKKNIDGAIEILKKENKK